MTVEGAECGLIEYSGRIAAKVHDGDGIASFSWSWHKLTSITAEVDGIEPDWVKTSPGLVVELVP
ncbi:MAG: hypothetical protein F6K36_08320 [Symploca sp. SIO3C6]|nr:hypothetical protein [Symploca sp. SIO3C6]